MLLKAVLRKNFIASLLTFANQILLIEEFLIQFIPIIAVSELNEKISLHNAYS